MVEPKILQENLIKDLYLQTLESIDCLDDLLNDSYPSDELKELIQKFKICLEHILKKVIEIEKNIKKKVYLKIALVK